VPLEESYARIVSTDEVDDSKVVEDVQFPPKTVNIIEDITVDSDKLFIDEIHMFSDSANDDVDEIVEPNTPTVPSQSFESPCAEYSFMVVPINLSFWESPEFLFKVQQMVSNTSFLGYLEFMSESHIPPSLDVCPSRHVISLILPSLGVIPRNLLLCICLLHILMISLG